MAEERKRPGNTPVEQQERNAADVEKTRPYRRAISGPGAADFIAAPGGLDTPESGGKGMAQTRGDGLTGDPRNLTPRPGPDAEEFPGERDRDENAPGSRTGTVGGGGFDAHNPSPERATGVDDDTAGRREGE